MTEGRRGARRRPPLRVRRRRAPPSSRPSPRTGALSTNRDSLSVELVGVCGPPASQRAHPRPRCPQTRLGQEHLQDHVIAPRAGRPRDPPCERRERRRPAGRRRATSGVTESAMNASFP
ncbi:hypothetical protein LV779_13860 [Streptomyces thinghirensis]|nr:hypothetical protein [Streptomyces thinghirensis]